MFAGAIGLGTGFSGAGPGGGLNAGVKTGNVGGLTPAKQCRKKAAARGPKKGTNLAAESAAKKRTKMPPSGAHKVAGKKSLISKKRVKVESVVRVPITGLVVVKPRLSFTLRPR